MLTRYSLNHQRDGSQPNCWAVDLFLDVNVPHEKLVSVLETMFTANEPPF